MARVPIVWNSYRQSRNRSWGRPNRPRDGSLVLLAATFEPSVATGGSFSGVIIAPLMPLAPGTKLGPYEIGAPLGAGGTGEVYRAKDTRLDRSVAAITAVVFVSLPRRATDV